VDELKKVIGILNPQKNPSNELRKYTNFLKKIRSGALPSCQFPDTLQDTHGIIKKPDEWKR